MISIDIVRAATLSSSPWSQLDLIVRAELATGRTTNEIHDQLRAMSKTIRSTPGLTADGADAFGDALDALIGNCPSKHAYVNSTVSPLQPGSAEHQIATKSV